MNDDLPATVFTICGGYFQQGSMGGGAPVFEVGYHPRKKNHVIRVVFQDQAMYARTSFRGAKTCKIRKKVCFWSY